MKKYTKDTELNDMLNNVAEISLSYNYKVKARDRAKATSADELSKAFFGVYDKGSIEVTDNYPLAHIDTDDREKMKAIKLFVEFWEKIQTEE